MKEIEAVIGLEVHVQLATETKMFCRCANSFGQPPNTLICPVCMGLPGSLPVVNKKAIDLGIKAGLALNCRINKEIIFERKNYFYPDLPKGYQISQYLSPLAVEGFLQIGESTIRITRAHLEEDAGKLVHHGKTSGVDFNRAGVPLLEIVSEPDIHSAQQAFDYLKALKAIMQYVGASSCDMEKGFLRCDANISLHYKGEPLGVKTELKNMNSFKGVRDALNYEIERQKKLLLSGKEVVQQTRLWDEVKGKTFPLRSKEEAHDYRYFPEPDLVKYKFSEEYIEEIRRSLPELPAARNLRFQQDYKLEKALAQALTEDKGIADFFEESLRYYHKPKNIANLIIGPWKEVANLRKEEAFSFSRRKAENLASIAKMFDEKKINNLGVKKLLALIWEKDEDAEQLAQANKLLQISTEDALEKWVEEAIKENPKPVNDYLNGKENALMFLVGMVMRKSSGQANPNLVKEMLKRRIRNEKN